MLNRRRLLMTVRPVGGKIPLFLINKDSIISDNTIKDLASTQTTEYTGTAHVLGEWIEFENIKYFFNTSIPVQNITVKVILKITDPYGNNNGQIFSIGPEQRWLFSLLCVVSGLKLFFDNGYNAISDVTVGKDNLLQNKMDLILNAETELIVSFNPESRQMRIYINGELKQNGSLALNFFPCNTVGCAEGTRRFNGFIKEFAIFEGFMDTYERW